MTRLLKYKWQSIIIIILQLFCIYAIQSDLVDLHDWIYFVVIVISFTFEANFSISCPLFMLNYFKTKRGPKLQLFMQTSNAVSGMLSSVIVGSYLYEIGYDGLLDISMLGSILSLIILFLLRS